MEGDERLGGWKKMKMGESCVNVRRHADRWMGG